MNYRRMGNSGLKISQVSVGSWMTALKDSAAVETAESILRLAYEKGVNFFDCADAYSGGEAEKFFGRCLSQFPRRELVLSSKVFFPTGRGINDRGLSRKHVFESVEQSLKNMKTDYLDLYFCHRFDPDTPVEETLRALDDLVHQGKILYYGVSEWMPSQVMEALGIIRDLRLYPLSVIQPQYNMVDRFIEDEMLDICRKNGIGVVTFSPLAQGLLTGKYRLGRDIPEGSRATHQADRQINQLLTEHNLHLVDQLLPVAEKVGVPLSVLALAWNLRDSAITSVITGASRPEQLQSNLLAGDMILSPDVIEKIDRILDYHPFRRKIG